MVARRKYSVLSSVEKLKLFGAPLLLEGEDPALYASLMERISASLGPVDAIDEMLVDDLVCSQWELMRYRRFKDNLIEMCGHQALRNLLLEARDDNECEVEELKVLLADELKEHFSEEKANELAHQYVLSDPDAVSKVDDLLNIDFLIEIAQRKEAEKLARGYARREPEVVKQVKEHLSSKGMTVDRLTSAALTANDSNGREYLATFERLSDQICMVATRRDAALRELDRHRATLGEAARRTVQNIEDGKFRVIE